MNDVNNWREEETLNLTSDISSLDGSDGSEENVETSTNTLKPQGLSVDTLGISEPQTPTPNLNASASGTPGGRLSLSQPVLSGTTPSPAQNRLNMSVGNISRPPRPQRVPLVKTQEENDALRREVAELNAKLSVSEYKVMELERMQAREVRDILQEYYTLQNSRFDLTTQRDDLAAAKRQLQSEKAQIEKNAQKVIMEMKEQLNECKKENDRYAKQNEELKEQVEELKAALAKMEEVPTSLDALKGDDSDWTIRSECDIVANELRDRLGATEKENEALKQRIEELQREMSERTTAVGDQTKGQTFVLGGGPDAEMLLQRIDNLEALLKEEEEERAKASTALVAYMQRYHILEKKLREKDLSVTNTSLKANSKEEVKALVEQLRNLLRQLGSENRELRRECARLLKEHNIASPNTTDQSAANESSNLTNATTERNLKANGDYENKQEKLLRDLNVMLEKDGNGSLIELLKDDFPRISDADFTSCDSPPFHSESVPRESLVPGNVQMMNASLIELMNLSLNTSKDIANLRERLGSFRGMMEKIFETLRSSGLLLEEVLLKLGSESEEHRQLAEKIREMKFAYNTYLNQSQDIVNVINETQFSMNDVELKMIAIEKSFNDASFRMDFSAHQTSARIFSQTFDYNSSQIREVATREQNGDAIYTQIASQKEEIISLLSLLEQAEKDRDGAVSAANELHIKMKELENEVAKLSEEREQLSSAAQSKDAEREKLLADLQEKRCAIDRLKQDQSEGRTKVDELLRSVAEKEAVIVKLQGSLADSKEMFEKLTLELKTTVLERERDVSKLQDALEYEHQRKNEENTSLKADLAAARETSQSLHRDIEKIRNECSLREATIRHLQDQLQTVMENNSRMADIISELQQETEAKGTASRKNSENAVTVVEVQTASSTPKVKSRDVQTDVTRTSLAQMELDSVAYSSELNALRTAYRELATVICELVVKDVNILPSPGDIASIEKSCKELSKFIRHEKKRRERQAIEIAEVTEKIKDLQQKGILAENTLKEVPQTINTEPAKHSAALKKYEDPLRQKLYLLTTMAMDLVTELRGLSNASVCGNKIDFTGVINRARELRNELNERFQIVRTDKENIHNYKVPDLLNMIELARKDNLTMYESLKRCKAEYEALKKEHINDPDLVKKIAAQLQEIHAAMGQSSRTYEIFEKATNKASKHGKQGGFS